MRPSIEVRLKTLELLSVRASVECVGVRMANFVATWGILIENHPKRSEEALNRKKRFEGNSF